MYNARVQEWRAVNTGKVGVTWLHAQKLHSQANDDHDDDAKYDDDDDSKIDDDNEDVDNDFDKLPYFEWKRKTAPEEEEEYDNEDSSVFRIDDSANHWRTKMLKIR